MSELHQVARALEFCVKHHRGQFRDGEAAVPYACHPIEVMLTLRNVVGLTDEALLTATVLHDTVEDTDATLDDIRREFGDQVAKLVGEVTRDEPPRPEGMGKEEYWMLRTELFLEEIREMSHEARLIKLSDRLNNIAESERTRTGPKRERYRKQTIWILQTIPRETQPVLWDRIADVLGMSAEEIYEAPQFDKSSSQK